MLSADGFGFANLPEIEPTHLTDFDCGKAHLNNFLHAEAREFQKARVGFTSVVFHRDVEGPVGYFTLANDALKLKTSESFDLGLDEF